MAEPPTRADIWLKHAQTLSVILGILGGAWSYYASQKNALIVARQPFLKLRQERYLQVSEVAAQLATADSATAEYKEALKRFRELYVFELSMVETPEVEAAMIEFNKALEKDSPTPNHNKLSKLSPLQISAYKLSHALRDSLCKDFGLSLAGGDPKATASSASQ